MPGRATRLVRRATARARRLQTRARRGFRRGLDDPTISISFDRRRGSHVALLAFGGMAGQLGMPPFEFFGVTKGLEVSRMFIRDLSQAWYHRGIGGLGQTIDEAADALGALLSSNDVDRVTVVGTSAGGYAALLFGTLLDAASVVSIVPQTVLDLDALHAMGDHRWDDQLTRLLDGGGYDERWSDLSAALPPLHRSTSYEIYFDPACEPDRLHAERMTSLAAVTLHHAPGNHNDVARNMRESGQLAVVLRRALEA